MASAIGAAGTHKSEIEGLQAPPTGILERIELLEHAIEGMRTMQLKAGFAKPVQHA